MSTLSILVVEDEPIIQEHLCQSIEDFGYLVCERFDEGEDAIDYLKNHEPDLVLLDISLGGLIDGIGVAEFIHKHKKIPFLFVSSYSDARTIQRAKLTMPSGYIVKPFEDSDIRTSIEIALYNHSQKDSFSETEQMKLADASNINKLFFKVKNEFIPIDLDEILWLEAKDNYCEIKTTSNAHLLTSTLGSVSDKLGIASFLRIHKSFIINTNKIEKVSYTNVTIDGVGIPIGRTYREKLNEVLNFF